MCATRTPLAASSRPGRSRWPTTPAGSLHTNLGAVAIGYHQTVCRTMTVHYTAHLMVYTVTWTNTGRVGTRSKNKILY